MGAVFKPGLYAITPQRYPDMRQLVDEAGLALEGGAAMLQFRDKSKDAVWRREAAAELCALCAGFGAPFIVNDDAQLAVDVGASGVHVGSEDIETAQARRMVGSNAMVGVSCYNRIDLARRARDEGANYVAFGSMFVSSSKPAARQCSTEVLRDARQLGLPVVAIGGITADNGASLVASGADSLAVISAVFDSTDVRAAARSFARLWQSNEPAGQEQDQ